MVQRGERFPLTLQREEDSVASLGFRIASLLG
jgi:hypothetical protein